MVWNVVKCFVTVLWDADRGDDFQIWREAASMLSRQSQTADKG